MALETNHTTEKEHNKGVQVYLSRPWELFQTIFMFITWIVLGIHGEIAGPTLGALAFQTGVAYTGISTIFTTRGSGYIVGTIVGGFMKRIIKRYAEVLLAIGLFVVVLVMFYIPYIHSLLILSIMFFCQGLSQGLVDVVGTVLVLGTWGNDGSTPLSMIHMGYGMGGALSIVIATRYIGTGQVKPSNADLNTTIKAISSSPSVNIKIPYAIVASLCLLVAIGHIGFAIRKHRTQRQARQVPEAEYTPVNTRADDERKADSSQQPQQTGSRDPLCFTICMTIIWSMHMFFVFAIDQVFGKFFFSYLKSPRFQISTQRASLVMILYWLLYAVGRLISAIATLYISDGTILMVLWFSGLVLSIAWTIYVWVIGLSIYSLFVLGSLTGLAFSPILPLALSFIQRKMNVNERSISIFLCIGSLGGILYTKLAGILMDRNPKFFPGLLLVGVVIGIICYFVTQFLAKWYRRRSINKP